MSIQFNEESRLLEIDAGTLPEGWKDNQELLAALANEKGKYVGAIGFAVGDEVVNLSLRKTGEYVVRAARGFSKNPVKRGKAKQKDTFAPVLSFLAEPDEARASLEAKRAPLAESYEKIGEELRKIDSILAVLNAGRVVAAE
jgi:dienelactone hydrolase